MRKNLKKFRIDVEMSQQQVADKLGCSINQISAIERGNRTGSNKFWGEFQAAFDIPDAEMWLIMKDE